MWFTPWTIKEFVLRLSGKEVAIYFCFLVLLVAAIAIGGSAFQRDVSDNGKECLNMPKYKKKPIVVEAVQWFEDGDHPEVKMIEMSRFDNRQRGDRRCKRCDLVLDGIHGEIETLEGVHIVCPGDFIITGVAGEHYPCKPDIFEQTYTSETTRTPDRSFLPDKVVKELEKHIDKIRYRSMNHLIHVILLEWAEKQQKKRKRKGNV